MSSRASISATLKLRHVGVFAIDPCNNGTPRSINLPAYYRRVATWFVAFSLSPDLWITYPVKSILFFFGRFGQPIHPSFSLVDMPFWESFY